MNNQIDLKKLISVIASILLTGAMGYVFPQNKIESEGKLLFRVKVSDAGLQSRFLDKGKQLTDFVETMLPGRLYSPFLQVVATERNSVKWDMPINAAAADFSAFKSDNRDWILEDFVPEEHDDVLSFLNDSEMHEKNRKVFESRRERYITGEAKYKDYALVFVRDTGDTHSLPLAFKKTPSGWKRTNRLSKDEVFDIVFSALANGGEVTIQH